MTGANMNFLAAAAFTASAIASVFAGDLGVAATTAGVAGLFVGLAALARSQPSAGRSA